MIAWNVIVMCLHWAMVMNPSLRPMMKTRLVPLIIPFVLNMDIYRDVELCKEMVAYGKIEEMSMNGRHYNSLMDHIVSPWYISTSSSYDTRDLHLEMTISRPINVPPNRWSIYFWNETVIFLCSMAWYRLSQLLWRPENVTPLIITKYVLTYDRTTKMAAEVLLLSGRA